MLKAKCYILRRDPVGRHATMQAKQCVYMCGRGCILVFALQQYTWTVYMNDEHLLLDYTQTEACTAHSMDSLSICMSSCTYMAFYPPSVLPRFHIIIVSFGGDADKPSALLN